MKEVLNDATVIYGPHDFSRHANQFSFETTVEELDSTNFAGGGWKEATPGLGMTKGNFSGFWDPTDGQKDSDLFEGLTGAPFIVSKTNPLAVGDVVYALRGPRTSYTPGGGQVGQLASITCNFAADYRPMRPMTHAIISDVSASGESDAQNLGAVTAGKKVYAILSIGGVTGTPTLDAVLESAPTDVWPGTSQISLEQETESTPRYQVVSAPGPIADPWWRLSWVLGGSGSFQNLRFFIYIG